MNKTEQKTTVKFTELPDRAVFKWKYPPPWDGSTLSGRMVKTQPNGFTSMPESGLAEDARTTWELSAHELAYEVICLSHYPQGEE